MIAEATALPEIIAELWPVQPKQTTQSSKPGDGFNGDDMALIHKAKSARNGAAFSRLWMGNTSDHRDDDSAADQSLCNHLAFWTGANADRIDRLFRQSGLYRAKWERADYRQRTIANAIQSCRAFHHHNLNGQHRQPNATSPPIRAITGASLASTGPEMNEPIVDGIFRVREIVNIISGSKSYKTYFLLAMLLSIAAGKSWLGFTTRRVRVLLIDNELHIGTLKHRIKSVASALAIDLDDLGDFFQVVPLRGHLQDIRQMRGFFAGIKPGYYEVIALDSWYRMIPAGMDENSNSEMTLLYNQLDEFAAMLMSAILLIHHTTKGRQGDKQITDVGSGAGAMSRAADCHLILRAHRDDGCAILQSALRSFPPMIPVGLRWTYPTWSPAPELNVADLQKDTSRRSAIQKPQKQLVKTWTAEEFVAIAVGTEPRPKALVLAKAGQAGITNRRAAELLLLAEESKLVFRHPGKDAREVLFATTERSVFDALAPSNGDIYHARKSPHTPRLRERTGARSARAKKGAP